MAKIDNQEKALKALRTERNIEPERVKTAFHFIEYGDIEILGKENRAIVGNLVVHNASSVIAGWNFLQGTNPGEIERVFPNLARAAQQAGVRGMNWNVTQLNVVFDQVLQGNLNPQDPNVLENYRVVMSELSRLGHWYHHAHEVRQQIVYKSEMEPVPAGVSDNPFSTSAQDVQYTDALTRNPQGVFNMIALNIQAYPPQYFTRILWQGDAQTLINLSHDSKYTHIFSRALMANAPHVLAGLQAYYGNNPAIKQLLPQNINEVLHDPDQARAWMYTQLTAQNVGQHMDAFIFAALNHHRGSPTFLQNLEQEQRDIREARDARLADGLIMDFAALCNVICTVANRSHKNLTNHNPELFFRYNSMHYPWAVKYDQDRLDQQRVIIPMEHTPVFQNWLTRAEAAERAGGETPVPPSFDEIRASLMQYNMELNQLLVRMITNYCNQQKPKLPVPHFDGDFGFQVELFDDRNVSRFGACIVLRADQFMGPIRDLGPRETILENLYKVAKGMRGSVDKPLERPLEAFSNIFKHNVTERFIQALPDQVADAIVQFPKTLREYVFALRGIGYGQMDPGANFSTLKLGNVYAEGANHPMLADRISQQRLMGSGQTGFGRALGSGSRTDPRLGGGDQ
ncbi:MAG: hypothetical protein J0L97_04225 [Alphaproteobacteria bacterium]|nr:hypothetical protein [Alphaproteobacteria bacterium]